VELEVDLELPEIEEVPKLTDDDITILAYTEQLYWELGELPSQEIVAAGFGEEFGDSKKKVQNAWNKERFQNALKLRGIEFKKEAKVLSPLQLIVANMMLNVADKRSLRQKLETVKVKPATYQGWLRDPVFYQYIKMRTEQLFQNADTEAFLSLMNAAVGGDVQALKLFFEMRGIYNPRLTVDINVESVVLRIVEIVAKNVKDPRVMEAIASEIQQIEIPRNAASLQI
jgi:hypothetical protein